MMSHSAVLAGKGGATVSWSIEKPKSNKIDSSLLRGATLYKLMERHLLTLEQQDFNGYPRPDPNERGRAIVNPINKFRTKPSVHLAPDERIWYFYYIILLLYYNIILYMYLYFYLATDAVQFTKSTVKAWPSNS